VLTYVRGNLFDSPAKVLVNTVNTVGVMGKGIALTFKQIYPEMFERYVALCESQTFDIGKLWLYRTDNKWVLNFPTKSDWRKPSKLEYIDAGLQKFAATYSEQNITSIAFPELGCGNGELDWVDVQPLMSHYLRALPITVYVYRYDGKRGKAEHHEISEMRKWLRAEPKSLPFDEFWSDLKATVGTGLTLTKLNNGETFTASAVRYDTEGLLLHVGERSFFQIVGDLANRMLQRWRFASKRDIFVPKSAILELWQSIRFYGYCHAQMMPDGLDVLSNYLLPILARLEYLRPAQLAIGTGNTEPEPESALQLYIPNSQRRPKVEQAQAVAA
jgi:O-acetyl-ADP-ribose deacetylase (regulator of RNase III)